MNKMTISYKQARATCWLISLAYMILNLIFNQEAQFAPDSQDYINFRSNRPPLYSYFIDLVGIDQIAIAQSILFSLSLCFTSLLLAKNLNPILGIGYSLLIVLHIHIFNYHSYILTESLFMSASLIFISLSIAYLVSSKAIYLFSLAIMVACILGIRYNGIAIWPILLLIAFIRPLKIRRYQRSLSCIIVSLPVLAMISLVSSRDGSGYYSNLHFYAKAAVIATNPWIDENLEGSQKWLADHIDHDLEPMRAYLSRQEKHFADFLRFHYEVCLISTCFYRDLTDHTEASREASPLDRFLPDELRAHKSLYYRYIVNNIENYIHLTLYHYINLLAYVQPLFWHNSAIERGFAQINPDEFPLYESFISPSMQMLPYMMSLNWKGSLLQIFMLAVGLFSGILALSTMALLIHPRMRTPEMTLACLSGLSAHRCLLLTALLVVFNSRYTLALWPFLALSCLLGGWILARKIKALAQS